MSVGILWIRRKTPGSEKMKNEIKLTAHNVKELYDESDKPVYIVTGEDLPAGTTIKIMRCDCEDCQKDFQKLDEGDEQ